MKPPRLGLRRIGDVDFRLLVFSKSGLLCFVGREGTRLWPRISGRQGRGRQRCRTSRRPIMDPDTVAARRSEPANAPRRSRAYSFCSLGRLGDDSANSSFTKRITDRITGGMSGGPFAPRVSHAFDNMGRALHHGAHGLVRRHTFHGLHEVGAHLRERDVVHVNTGKRTLELVHQMAYGSPTAVLLFFSFIYSFITALFGVAFWFLDENCFKLDDDEEFDFAYSLWISVHIFSTIGFGNIAPRGRCWESQLIVLAESFISLLVTAAIGGYVVKSFLRPLSAVRFSSKVLINHGRRRMNDDDDNNWGDDDSFEKPDPNSRKTSGCDGSPVRKRLSHTADDAGKKYQWITFRMVRQGRVQLRDVRVHMQAQYWVAGATAFADRDSHMGRVVTLQLEQDYFTTLEQLQVWHRIDERSPLWRMRDSLLTHLYGLEVSISAFDCSSLQQVMFFKKYSKNDVKNKAVFDNNLKVLTVRRPGNTKFGVRRTVYQADHSKIDAFSTEIQPTAGKRTKRGPGGCKRSSSSAGQGAADLYSFLGGLRSSLNMRLGTNVRDSIRSDPGGDEDNRGSFNPRRRSSSLRGSLRDSTQSVRTSVGRGSTKSVRSSILAGLTRPLSLRSTPFRPDSLRRKKTDGSPEGSFTKKTTFQQKVDDDVSIHSALERGAAQKRKEEREKEQKEKAEAKARGMSDVMSSFEC